MHARIKSSTPGAAPGVYVLFRFLIVSVSKECARVSISFRVFVSLWDSFLQVLVEILVQGHGAVNPGLVPAAGRAGVAQLDGAAGPQEKQSVTQGTLAQYMCPVHMVLVTCRSPPAPGNGKWAWCRQCPWCCPRSASCWQSALKKTSQSTARLGLLYI